MKHKIEITEQAPLVYRVTVTEGATKTNHEVTLTTPELAKYAPNARPEALLSASFEFLLEREPKESILRRFAISDIEKYFPDFASKIRARL
jgi:hypothetical protein